jgi:hypothetical protein
MTKISPKLCWLTPYLSLAMPHIPKNKCITRISLWSAKNKRVGTKEKAAIYTNNLRSYRIYISDMYVNSSIDTLTLLAHELAHTLDMMHSPEHKLLESKLLTMFMKHLQSTGYVNEELELKNM